MDYKEKYEQALERAKGLYSQHNVEWRDEDIEYIFPELKESEDERIRKELIRMIKEDWPGRTDVIAWLEKQGQVKESLISQHENKMCKENDDSLTSGDERIRKEMLQIAKESEDSFYMVMTPNKRERLIDWLEKQGEQNLVKANEEWYDFIRWFVRERTDNYTLIPSDNDIHKWGDMILNHAQKIFEKQGEQKPVIEMKTPEESLGIDSDTYNKIVEECVYGEQKPADKAEPKFLEGDFILNGDVTDDGKPEIFRVLKVCDTWYDVENIYDSRHTIITFKQECSCRVWNIIQDAKDGDVLATEPIEGYHYPFVAIYKKQNEEDFASYCFIGFDGKFYKGENNHSTEEVHPATKEQRDTLEKAMADAGYTFNFEKKELKKVEQKPQRMISAEAKEALYDKPAWSEEDELKRSTLIHIVKKQQGSAIFEGLLPEELIDWLKSLKDRVQPQPKKEWSKEDHSMKHFAYCRVYEYEKKANALPDAEEARKCMKWLDSLKDRYVPQPQQEWSEEDEFLRKTCIGAIQMCTCKTETKDKIINWLKSLRPQKQWKPSDKQMDALLSEVTAWTKGCPKQIILESLYNDLKKLKEE